MTTKFQKLLEKVEACSEARDWVGTKSFTEAYETCSDHHHLLWFVDKPGVLDDRRWRLLACAFARTVLPFAGELTAVCLATIEVAERFAAGGATQDELTEAYGAAYGAVRTVALNADLSAACSAAWNSAWNAAWSAVYSAVYSADGKVVWSAKSAADTAVRAAALTAAGDSTAYSAASAKLCFTIRQHVSCREVYDGYKANYPEMFT